MCSFHPATVKAKTSLDDDGNEILEHTPSKVKVCEEQEVAMDVCKTESAQGQAFIGKMVNEVNTPMETTTFAKEYESHEKRLKSFSDFPTHLRQQLKHLADFGYFYTGRDDVVTCFSCGAAHGDWSGKEDPVVEHCRWYPNCGHMRRIQGDGTVNNILNAHKRLLEKLEGDASMKITEEGHKLARQLFTEDDRKFYVDAGIPVVLLDQASSEAPPNASKQQVLQKLAELIQLRPQKSWGIRYYNSKNDTYEPDEEGLATTDQAGLPTFASTTAATPWPQENVTSAMCAEELHGPLPTSVGLSTSSTVPSAWDEPRHPEYQDEKKREDSFARWPMEARGKLHAKNFALSGLFYEGSGCTVVCFSCGATFHCWGPWDDPFVRHCETLSPLPCYFICTLAGKRSVHYIRVQHQEDLADLAEKGVLESTEEEKMVVQRLLSESDFDHYTMKGIQNGLLYKAAIGLPPGATKGDLKRRVEDLIRPRLDPRRLSPCTDVETAAPHAYTMVDLRTGKRDGLSPEIQKSQVSPENREGGFGVPEEEFRLHEARYPRYDSLAERQRSFATFLYPATGKLHGDNFAKVGFFYQGDRDQVTCYCCGMPLGNWCPSHDPFVEHCLFSPTCSFIHQCAAKCAKDYITVGHPQLLEQLAAKGFAEATLAQRKLVHHLLSEIEVNAYSKRGIRLGLLYLAADGLQPSATKDDLKQQVADITRVKLDSTISPCTPAGNTQSPIRRTIDLKKKAVVCDNAFPPDGSQEIPPELGAAGGSQRFADYPLQVPKHPELATVATSSDSPQPTSCQVDTLNMALAGRLSTGRGDETQRFHCGNMFHSWDPGDILSEQRAKCHTKCEHSETSNARSKHSI